MYVKSKTCKGKHSGTYLNEYASIQEAQYHADYLHNEFVPYQCGVCNKWHLSPNASYGGGDRSVYNTSCGCKNSFGKRKELYSTKSAAEQRAVEIGREKGIVLSVYKCKKGKGWHLSKR